MGYSKLDGGGLSVSAIFCLKFQRGSRQVWPFQLFSPGAAQRLQVHKENALTERVRWKRSARLEASTVL